MNEHWTDSVTTFPIFTTVISGRDSNGNIYAILSMACRLLRKVDIPKDRIERLKEQVRSAQNYDQAVAFVERWFRVERDDD